jgi:hypothetical protein
VQVYLADLKYKNAADKYIPVENFSPMRIVWSHYRTRTLDVLSPECRGSVISSTSQTPARKH